MEWITHSHFKSKEKIIAALRYLHAFSFEKHEEELKSMVNKLEKIL